MAVARKFGTFGGVFTPSILTILGVIMYLRLPSIVGQAGLWTTIGIIIVAHVISVATGLSVASIATDKKVQAGGTYYMLSRSLGLPIGGTLGLALFVGLSFSVSLYVIGFSESFLAYWGWEVSKNTIRFAGSITLIAVTIVTLISTALALKAQFFIMAAIGISLLSIFFGRHDLAPEAPLLQSLPDAAPFIVLFGIFFPAVTGFEAGVSMSGDLRDPKKSIPSGTIWAIAIGLLVYLGMAMYFSFTVSAEQLTGNPNVLLDIALFGPAVIAGIWGATVSSALGSILGAPRILQATASDRIVHRFFAVGYGKENEPRNALILTFLIAEAGILIGELDVIARIVSMFFITTYGFLNLSCFIESWASPDFRPDFKIPSVVNLLGAVACFVVMIQLDFVAMIGATVLLGLVFLYLKRKELTLETGDTWEGFWSSVLRSGLQRLARIDVHERNWRPNILLFNLGTNAREHMVAFGMWLVHKRGLLSDFDLVVNPQLDRLKPRSTQAIDAEDEVEVGIFSRRLECPDAFEAMESIGAFYGFSGVEPNTVIMGWASHSRDLERLLELIKRYVELDLNLLFLDVDEERGYGERSTIDVWWRGGNNNISLTLALIRFLTASDSWAGVQIRFLVVNESDTAYSDAIRSRMDGILETYRINARAQVINNVVGRKPIHEIIRYESAKTDLTIIGMPPVSALTTSSYMEDTTGLLEKLGTVLLVKASSFFNHLSMGIETAPRKEEKAQSGELGPDELPAVDLPADETLRWALQRMNEEFDTIAAVMVNQPFVALADMHRDMGKEICDAIERTFHNLSRLLDKQDRPRARKSINRAQATLAFQAHKTFSSYIEEQLPVQQKLLETTVLECRSEVRNLIRQTPDTLKRLLEREEGDGSSPGGNELSLLRRLTNRPRSVTIPFRDLIEARANEDFYRLTTEALQSLCGAVHAFSENVLTQLQNAFDALQRIEKNVDAGKALSLTEEQGRVELALKEILQEYEHRQQTTRNNFRLEVRKLAQTIIRETETATKTPVRNKGEEGRLSAVMLEIPKRWEENQLLLLNRALLGVQLISFKQRLRTIVFRYRDDVSIFLQNTLLKPLREMEEDLESFTSLPDKHAEARMRSIHAITPTLDFDSVHRVFVADIRSAIEEIPEAMRTIPEHAVQVLAERALEEVEVITVSLRRVIDYIVEMELLGPIQQELAMWPVRTQRIYVISQDVWRLVAFQMEDRVSVDGSTDSEEAMSPLLEKGLERLQSQLAILDRDCDELGHLILSRLDTALQLLNPYTITRTEGDLQRYVRGHTSRQIQSRFQDLRRRTETILSDSLVNLLYRRSEGVLFARKLQESDPFAESAAIEGLRVLERLSPGAEVLEKLPLYYRQLFLDLPNITQEFWVGADAQLQRAHKAVERWKRGVQGGLLVLGEAYSGKTALCQRIAQTHFARDEIFILNPVRGGTCDPDALERELKRAFGATGAIDEVFVQLPAHCAVIVNDLERWWERSADGNAALLQIERWLERYGSRCFFLINANTHAFNLINRLLPLTNRFLDVLTRTPANARQIQEIIMLRHRSAGLTFELDEQSEDEVSAWKLARLFTSIFDYARGNVGAALQAWIVAVRRVTPRGMAVELLDMPEMSVVDGISSLQRAILVHLLLHGQLTFNRLLRISELEESHLRHEIQALQRLEWVREKDQGVLAVDRFLQPHLTQAFVERRLI